MSYKAPATVARFLRSSDFVRCIIGPVGSGKSSACVVEILRRAVEQAPGPDGVRRTRFVVIRNTYGQLRDTTRKTFEQWIPPSYGRWHEQAFTFEMDFVREEDDTSVHCEVLFRALDRPEDVAKLLSLEVTGAYINEVREVPKHVLDVLQTRVGRYPSKAQGGASWYGIWMDSNPWHGGHWGSKLFAKNMDGYRIFRQPGGRAANAENLENLPSGYYERLCAGKDQSYIDVYVDGKDADSAVGSIFGAWIASLRQNGGVCAFDHPNTGVLTSWDLGHGDATGIWFWRINAQGVPDIIDHYESAGQGLAHYFGVVDSKPYKYVHHWLPHDAKAKTLATQVSVYEQCAEHWGPGMVDITPNLSIADGISAGRWLLEQPIRIHERCDVPGRLEHSGLEALGEYRYEWDEVEHCFSRQPLHNWASHTGSAWRYLALVAKHSELMTRPAQPKSQKPYAVPVDRAISLDRLMQLNEEHSGGRGRI